MAVGAGTLTTISHHRPDNLFSLFPLKALWSLTCYLSAVSCC